uniref:Uncharacterized protein n=1 Tax=Oryza glaberrima TaxID=4538 RepID=I1R5C7_ORYGL
MALRWSSAAAKWRTGFLCSVRTRWRRRTAAATATVAAQRGRRIAGNGGGSTGDGGAREMGQTKEGD